MEQMEYIEGTFLEELENRFRGRVKIGSRIVPCYIPSSSKLGNLLELPGKKVRLVRRNGKLVLWAVAHKRSYIYVCCDYANELFGRFLKNKELLREHTVLGYRFDFYDPQAKIGYEIKSLITAATALTFPNVKSERRLEQLKRLKRVLARGIKVRYILISLSPFLKQLTLAATDRTVASLCQLERRGLELRVYRIRRGCGLKEIKFQRSGGRV